jgi:uncharacterized repeat protein (TIGR03803 family)
MRKVSTLLLVLLVCLTGSGQGIYQIWGTAAAGGNDNTGTLFSMDGNTENFQRRFSFDYNAPGFGKTGLVEYNFQFYGITQGGGSNGVGVLFHWDTALNVLTKRFDFIQSLGRNPNTYLTLVNGKIYGTTMRGGTYDGGVLFEFDPATNIYSVKYEFNVTNPVGSLPLGGLTLHEGKLYGTTSAGSANGFGSMFKWDSAANTCIKEFDFSNSGGFSPQGVGVSYNGKIYGITNQGGNFGPGVIYEWNPTTKVFSKKVDFVNLPFGSLALKDGKFYGTSGTGPDFRGFIYEWDPLTNIHTTKFSFATTTASAPRNGLTLDKGRFYGTTLSGGSNNGGVIYEWDPTTNTYKKLFDFAGTHTVEGAASEDPLIVNSGRMLGSAWGGTNGSGLLYEFSLTGKYTRKNDFNSSNGSTPTGKLTQLGNKLYGLTRYGGDNGAGVIYEWDMKTNRYELKVSFPNNEGADNPIRSMTYYKGKFYGTTGSGGVEDAGVIYEWDPSTNVFVKRLDLISSMGWTVTSDFAILNDKFYATTYYGGAYNQGVIFEWDPATNIYTKKYDFKRSTGLYADGALTYYNGKFYGTTRGGGDYEGGVIYEWDPVTNVYTKKFDFNSNTSGGGPTGELFLKEGKLYGSTYNSSFFEFDPSTNIYATKIGIGAPGGGHYGNLILNGSKFYGITGGGIDGAGVIFEWDLSSNVYTTKRYFTGDDGRGPQGGLTVATAPIAKGSPGNCTTFPLVTIDNTNNNTWVPITDEDGNAIAEIKANGNNLGVITTSMYVNNARIREDKKKRLYLDRNITIKPQFQPSSPVDIRLYISAEEYIKLKNAVNSEGQGSGITGINDLWIFKHRGDVCGKDILQVASPVISNVAPWGGDYVLSASISSFSSFYFANKSFTSLPLNFVGVEARLENEVAIIKWTTDNEQGTSHFDIERSVEGVNYKKIGTVASANATGTHHYTLSDPSIGSLNKTVIYYRVKQVDIDDQLTISKVVSINLDANNRISLFPNPVTEKATLYVNSVSADRLEISMLDNHGRVVRQQQTSISTGNNVITIDTRNLSGGVYYLVISGQSINKRFNFFKP